MKPCFMFKRHQVEKNKRCDLFELPGQFQCGNKRCENQEGLKSWEVNFAYVEQGEKRNALVKLSKYSVFPTLTLTY